ncbi:MAG: hypothetical protein Q8Q10_01495 [bacterium]|nr:hypothetical protein [bacterium]
MSKSIKVSLIAGTVILLGALIFGGWWYVSKTRECVKEVRYQPPREQTNKTCSGGFLPCINDKGDYYTFVGKQFKTSEDATRACMWE